MKRKNFSAPIRPATNRAISVYGSRACLKAYKLHADGESEQAVSAALGLTTRQAGAAIDAGRQIALLAWEAGLTPISLTPYLKTLYL